MKNNNSLFIVMLIFSITIILGTGAYAYYRSNMTGTVSGTIAKWSFTANDQTSTMNINFNGLYPGKSGVYNIELSAENSDLDVYYEFNVESTDANFASKLFLDSSYTKNVFSNVYNDDYYPGRYGVIPAGQTVTVPIYFNWPYNTSDDSESLANGNTSNFATITIIGRQYTANSGSIPMSLIKCSSSETINATSGYCTDKINYDIHEPQ